jgi:hypothetical protein
VEGGERVLRRGRDRLIRPMSLDMGKLLVIRDSVLVRGLLSVMMITFLISIVRVTFELRSNRTSIEGVEELETVFL